MKKFLLFGLLLILFSSYVSANPTQMTDGLIAYYNMDGSDGFEDALGNWDGTTTGTIQSSNCVIGKCRSSTAGDDYSMLTGLPLLADRGTVAGWSNATCPGGDTNCYVFGHYTTDSRIYVQLIDGGTFRTTVGGGTNHDYSTTFNEWHHYALTWTSGNTYHMFIDGSEVTSGGGNVASIDTNKIMFGGYGVFSSGGEWQGLLDEFAIYNKSLNSTELTQLYNYGLNGTSYPFTGGAPATHNPVLVNNITTPLSPTINDDLNFTLLCTDSDSGDTLTGYVQLYRNTTAYGGVHSTTVINDTNTSVYVLASTNTSYAETWTGGYWCGDGTTNTTKQNNSVIVAAFSSVAYLNIINASLLPVNPYTNITLLGYCEGNSSSSLNFNLKIYKNNIISNTIQEGYCYQEFANISNECNNSNNGSYSSSGSWATTSLAGYDGDYSTSARGAPGAGESSVINITYSIPQYAKNTSLWQVKYDRGSGAGQANLGNYSIPDQCWNNINNTLKFRIVIDRFAAPIDYDSYLYCYNSTSWLLIYSATTSNNDDDIYEEGMYWHTTISAENNILTNVYNISNTLTTKNDSYIFSCQAYNSTTNSTWFNSSTVTILNSLPVITNPSPSNNYVDNLMPNLTATITDIDLELNNCSLYWNGTLNQTKYDYPSGSNPWFTFTNLTNAIYPWYINCTDGENWGKSTTFNFVYDTINPIIRMFVPNSSNTTITNNPTLTTYIQITDLNLYYATLNVTNPVGTNILSNSYNLSAVTIYDINETITHGLSGNYTISVLAADAHTKTEIPKLNIKKGFFNEKITLKHGGELTIDQEDDNFKDVDINKKKDRYSFKYKRKKDRTGKDYDSFIVESTGTIDILNSDYEGHLIIKEGDITTWKWLDFETPEHSKVEIERLNNNKVRVKVYTDGKKDIEFNSLGLLNIKTQTIFYEYLEVHLVNVSSFNRYNNSAFNNYTLNIQAVNASTAYDGEYNISTIQSINVSNGTYWFNFSSPKYISQNYFVDSTGEQILVYNTSQSRVNFRLNNIETGSPITGADISITNLNTGMTNIVNGTSTITSFFINAGNYSYNITANNYAFTVGTFNTVFLQNLSITESLSIVARFNLYDEQTLGMFNVSSADTIRFLYYCENRTVTTVVTTNTPEVPIVCDYFKFKFVLEYPETNYYRTLIKVPPTNATEAFNTTVYLINALTTPFLYNSFIIDDLLGDYEDTSIYVKKIINDSQVQITADQIDIESKIGAYLIENHEYIIEVHSSNNPDLVLGFYAADLAGDKILKLYDINLNSIPSTFASTVTYSTGIINITNNDKMAIGRYQDIDNDTSNVRFFVYGGSYNGTVLYNISSASNDVTFMYNITPYYNTTSLYTRMEITHTSGQYVHSKMLHQVTAIVLDIFQYVSQAFMDWFFVILLSVVAIMATIRTANYLSIALIGVAALFVLFGWFTVSSGILALAALFSLGSLLKQGDNSL